MQILRLGVTDPAVAKWQAVVGVTPTGIFNQATKEATENFQRMHGLDADGEVGPNTLAVAARLGLITLPSPVASGYYPPRPSFSSPTPAQRDQMFGRFAWKRLNGTDIKITDGWAEQNIIKVHIPQLVGVKGAPADGWVYFHRKGAAQLKAFFAEVEAAGLKHLIISWAGSFYPRFIRGSQSSLSNHSWGTAFDINAPENWLNQQPAAEGKKGSLLRLVPIANKHGFFWGGHYNSRLDGMHFELAKIQVNPFAGLLETGSATAIENDGTSGPAAVETTNELQNPQIALQSLPTNQAQTQVAETIVNTGDTAPAQPAPEDKTLSAPAKDGATASATKGTVLGIAVPGFIVTAIAVAKDAIAQGYISAADVGSTVLTFIRENQKYVFILIGLLIVLQIVKKVFKQVAFLISMITHAIPGWNNVTVVPFVEPEPESKWWQFWK